MRMHFLAVGLIAPLILGGVSISAYAVPLLGHHPALQEAVSLQAGAIAAGAAIGFVAAASVGAYAGAAPGPNYCWY